jgi:hypothetical protein
MSIGQPSPAAPPCETHAMTTHRAHRIAPAGWATRPFWLLGHTISAALWATVEPNTMRWILNPFSNCEITEIVSKLRKSIEICSNVQNLQSKFCMNPLEQIYAVGLTKYLFVHYCLVQDSKNLNLV